MPHGSFGAHGIARAIDLAARGARTGVVERTHERLAAAGALRERRAGAALDAAGPSEPAATVPDP